MNKMHTGMMSVILGAAVALTGCFETDDAIEVQFEGDEAPIELAPLAIYDATSGLQFASEEVAQEWTEEAPGVWRQRGTGQQLVMGARGHESAVALLRAELDQLRADGAEDGVIQGKQARLADMRAAADKARDLNQTEASCEIGLYNGPSSPITGYVGGAALAELRCFNGSVMFTVNSQVCISTYGSSYSCTPTHSQTVIVGSTWRTVGTVSSGSGLCSSWVSVSPSGFNASNAYPCN